MIARSAPRWARWSPASPIGSIVTSDNPRHEEPNAIIRDILGGMNDTDVDIQVEPDRRTAIAAGLAPLTPGDVLVVAGKGHERTQDLGDRVVDFDDRAVITELLEADLLGVGRDRHHARRRVRRWSWRCSARDT